MEVSGKSGPALKPISRHKSVAHVLYVNVDHLKLVIYKRKTIRSVLVPYTVDV